MFTLCVKNVLHSIGQFVHVWLARGIFGKFMDEILWNNLVWALMIKVGKL